MFDLLTEQVKENVDIQIISETKLDESFSDEQLRVPGLAAPFQKDWNSFGGGIMVLIREDILSKFLLLEPEPFEGLYIELSLRRKKWLINCSYNPHINSLPNHLAVKQKVQMYIHFTMTTKYLQEKHSEKLMG